jgi:MYXO-CTERM domain-containing protein
MSHAWISLDDNATPPHTVWGALPPQYSLNDAGCVDIGGFSNTETIVLDSFATWSAPVCTLWDTYYRGSTTRFPRNDAYNVIGWAESSWPHSSSAIGVCEVYFRSTWEIGQADIRMNGEDFTWNTTGSGGVDTQSITTHEMGHFVGLGDLYGSDCSMGQTMCGTYGGGRSKRTLTSDDIDGVCNLYPTGCTTPADCPAGFDCVGGTCVPLPSDVCTPCDYHAECGGPDDYCISGFPDGNTYCGKECVSDTDCDWGFVCATLTGGEKQCLPFNMSCDPPPAPECEFDTDCPARYACIDMLCIGSLCAECTDHYDCGGSDDYCVTGFTDGLDYCGVRCIISSDCPFGFHCIGVGGTQRQCVPTDNDCATPPEQECWTDDDCDEGYYCELGYCYPEPECLTSDDCPEGEICVDDECVPDPAPHLPLCSECTRHSECGYMDDLCLGGFLDGTMRCGVSCDSMGGDCGEGLICYELEGLPDQCIPATFDCTTFCTADDECPDGEHCEEGRCSDACDPSDPASCPEGFYCDQDTCTTGNCVALPEEPGTAGPGDHCTEDANCESLRCREVIDDAYCSDRCDFLGDGECPEGMECQPLEGGACGYCACSAGMLGDPCGGSEDCLTGVCAGVCSKTCEDASDCPSGYSCSELSGYMLCLPDGTRMGEACEASGDCASGLCARVDDYNFCTRTCDDANCNCPSGFICREASGGATVCAMTDMPDPDDGEQTSGCGCTVVGQGKDLWPGALLLASLLLLALRRRKI